MRVLRWPAVAALCAVSLGCSVGTGTTGTTETTPRPAPAITSSATPTPTPSPTPKPTVDAKKLTKRLDRLLGGRGIESTLAVLDLETGLKYGYHPKQRVDTASTVKVGIAMARLLRTPWRKLSRAERREISNMLRHSDNRAADRMWERIGHASGYARAMKKFGLRQTHAIDAKCIDLYCWGITETSARDQVRLLRSLVDDESPLAEEDSAEVLNLMGKVIEGQGFGISAAACKGDEVAVKNGWLRHVSNKAWNITSIGRITGNGHDFLIAVLTDGHASQGSGIATVEKMARLAVGALRTTSCS